MDVVDLELRRGRGHTGVYLSQKTNKGCAQVQFKDASWYQLYVTIISHETSGMCMWKVDQGSKFLIFRKPSNRSILKKKKH